MSKCKMYSTIIFGSAVLLSAMARPSRADAPPATAPARPTEKQLLADIQKIAPTIKAAFKDNAALVDPVRRKQIAETTSPLLRQFANDFQQIAAIRPSTRAQAEAMSFQSTQLLSLLGDAEATRMLTEMSNSPDTGKSMRAQAAMLMNRWTLADKNLSQQTAVADELEPLDREHTDSIPLTVATARMSSSAASPQLADRLGHLVSDVMANSAADQYRLVKARAAAASRLGNATGKPLTIAGKTVDGKPFSTDAWRGKVILVDFWATWCGPCKRELPDVQQLYTDLHGKGLEVVGVSNDYSADALQRFVADKHLPWPQLYDDAAGSSQIWNPITTGFGINAIPHMLVIDKSGTLIDADAGSAYRQVIEKALAS